MYPKDFTIKGREEGKMEKRKRRRPHVDMQNSFPTSAAEALLTLASSGSGPSSDPNLLIESGGAGEQKVPVAASTGRSRGVGGLQRSHHTNVSPDVM